ncbi:hypothetical protein KA005_28665 [bacterium]|nr:hypothetical protein [bacterium]
MPGNGNGGNGNDKDEKTKGFDIVKPRSQAEQFRRKARGVDFARNLTALAKKFNIAPLRQEEKLGITLEGANGEWYAWDSLVVRFIAYLDEVLEKIQHQK